MTTAICVWIVNFQSATHTLALLDDLDHPMIGHIYILDNGSTDGDFEALVRGTDGKERVTLYRSEANLGFGGGHNELARRTSAAPDDLIWLLNPDIRLGREEPARLAQTIESGIADIVSPVIVTRHQGVDRIWFSGGRIERTRGVSVDSQLGRDVDALLRAPAHVSTEFMTGAAPMMKRSTWDELGGFDAELFLYWEDVEWSLRANELGLRLVVNTKSVINHLEGASSKSNRGTRSNAFYYMSRNRILVCRRPGTRGFGLVIGKGAIAFARFMAYALIREGRGGLARLLAAVRGAVAALANVGETGAER